jgi:hypothetical protein
MKKVAILQSNYIPWKGYFDVIAAVDEFIIYDDMQFTKNDWRNRNLIKTPSGLQWLSIPVGQGINRRIRDVLLPANNWQEKHWKTLVSNYARAPFFDEIANWLQPIYLDMSLQTLSDFNCKLIKTICCYLKIPTIIKSSSDYNLGEGKSERLVHICRQAGADIYLSGPSAASYLDELLFKAAGIGVEWFDYSNYPTYQQLWGEFAHNVSIIDLLFNCGKDSLRLMKSGKGGLIN